mmetsp:Transcript_31445/g.57994  ORF Transcript_31445/g.57994 Transcript_31445/m.57994 type:complete len:206 (+) Transcript_31445:363-980(+)
MRVEHGGPGTAPGPTSAVSVPPGCATYVPTGEAQDAEKAANEAEHEAAESSAQTVRVVHGLLGRDQHAHQSKDGEDSHQNLQADVTFHIVDALLPCGIGPLSDLLSEGPHQASLPLLAFLALLAAKSAGFLGLFLLFILLLFLGLPRDVFLDRLFGGGLVGNIRLAGGLRGRLGLIPILVLLLTTPFVLSTLSLAPLILVIGSGP